MRHLTRISALLIATAILSVSTADAEVNRREKGNLVIEDIPEIPAEIHSKLRQYQNTRSAVFRGWDRSGGGLYIATRFGDTTQLHHVEQPGGARRQLTFFREPVGYAAASPDPDNPGILFTRDAGGGEYYQIYFFDAATGANRLLSDGKSLNGSPVWSNAGDRIAYFSTRRNSVDWDIYISDINGPEGARRVLDDGGTWFPVHWSADDSELLVSRYVSATESWYYVLNIESGTLEAVAPKNLDAGGETVAYGAAVFAGQGDSIYLTTDAQSEFLRLGRYERSTGLFTEISGDIPWDVDELALSNDGRNLAFTTNEDGMSRLYLMRTDKKRYHAVDDLPVAQFYGLEFHPDGKRLALVINGSRSPGDVYSLSLKDNKLTQWTSSEVGGLNPESLVEPRLIHYPTYDTVDGARRQIPAFYYQPRKGKGPFPVVVVIHGGPESQIHPYFFSSFHYYVNELGAAVLAPNVRGSSGYGKSYLKLDNGRNRKNSVKDIGALLDWIDTQPELDPDRVAVTGGSYGGYMVLATMIDYQKRVACGIDRVGISNFVTFLENTNDYRRDLRRVEYGDERDPSMRQFLQQISPTNSADQITRPLLVVQGKNDPRVPVTESEQMVQRIRDNGNTVWYLMATDEGHGFKKKINRDYYLASAALFLQQCLHPGLAALN